VQVDTAGHVVSRHSISVNGSDSLSLHLYFRATGQARKGGCSLLPVGAKEHRELELPSGWSL
jgi:hypothetical protein